MHKDLRELAKKLTKQGFEIEPTKNGHYTVRKDGSRVATLPGSPSDHRAMANVVGVLKRAGFRP